MTRKKLSPEAMQQCIKGHLVPDVGTAYDTVCSFLEDYEMSAGVVQNIISAKKHLQQALALSKAAEVINDFAVED